MRASIGVCVRERKKEKVLMHCQAQRGRVYLTVMKSLAFGLLLLTTAVVTATTSDVAPMAKHAATPHPARIVAQKHHSGKLLTERQLRANAAKIKPAAKKLMGTKPSELMPTWSTTTPIQTKKLTIIDEGIKNLKLQKDIAQVEKHDDAYFQADSARTSGN